MLRLLLFICFFTVNTDSKSYRLEYGFEQGQRIKYEFKGRHQARLVSIEDIRSADERMEGHYEDEIWVSI